MAASNTAQLTVKRASFVIGVLNERRRLPGVIDSIHAQTAFADDCEIIITDGGSSDGTPEYAQARGCRVIHNPLGRCEPGIALGVEGARGEIVITMAADNPLHDAHFLEHLLSPFENPRVVAVMPRVESTRDDCATNRYLNAFTDPFNHFVYWNVTSPPSYPRKYLAGKDRRALLYDLSGVQPLVALAQGFAFRRAVASRPVGTEEDDVAPAQAIVAVGLLAYAPDARIEHHTVSSLRNFIEKFEPRIAARLRDNKMPAWSRARSESSARRLRRLLWPFYAISIFLPVIVSLFKVLSDRRKEWLTHPIVSFVLATIFWKQLFLHFISIVRKPHGTTF